MVDHVSPFWWVVAAIVFGLSVLTLIGAVMMFVLNRVDPEEAEEW